MLEIFTGNELPSVLHAVRRRLGPEACIVDVTCAAGRVEVLASTVPVTVRSARAVAAPPALGGDPDPAAFGAVLRNPDPVSAPRPALRPRRRNAIRPRVVALVGPTGAGKTTTIAKLATNPLAFGGQRVGLLTLDTYRIAAVEQLETYAELAQVPCEVIYDEADVESVLSRLIECDVILVDTPGRGPRQSGDLEAMRTVLACLAPDETHLVLPASAMPQVLRRVIQQFAPFGVTHMLATKVDECPLDTRVFDLVVQHGGAMRWLTDGQEVPVDLRSASVSLRRAANRREISATMEVCA